MRQDSQKYAPLIVPLIHNSVEPSSETRQYLLEEALDLWSSILEHTPQPCPLEIIGLAANLFPMFDSASDTLVKSLGITELYIYLIPQEMLSSSSQLFSAWNPLLTSLKSSGVLRVTNLIELLIRQAYVIGTVSGVEQLSQSMYEYNVTNTVLLGLKSAHSAHQTTGPNRMDSQIDSQVETDYLSMLGRLALASPQVFINVLATYDTESGTAGGETLRWLLEEWFSHFDDLISPDRKKLSCLALTALLNSSVSTMLLKNLQSLMSIQTDTIMELLDADTGADCLIMWSRGDSTTNDDGLQDSNTEILKRDLLLKDPVRRLDVKIYVRENLSAAIAKCGGETAFREQWLVNVDQDVVRAFGDLGVLQ